MASAITLQTVGEIWVDAGVPEVSIEVEPDVEVDSEFGYEAGLRSKFEGDET